MAVKRLANLRPQYDDGNGDLASGYRLFFYQAGSSTKQNTYNSSSGGIANSNPITLNSRGEPSVEIWGTVGQTYKIGLAVAGTDDPPASFIWTEDNVSCINDTTSQIDEWVASGLTPTYVSATQFTLSGDQTSTFTVGRRLKLTVTAGTVYGRITASAFGALTTVTVQCDGSQAIDNGLSAVSYGLLASTVLSIPQRIATSAGTDTYTATVGMARKVIGDEYRVKIASTNTVAAPTLNLDSTGASTIVLPDGSALVAGDLNGQHTFRWDGTNYLVLNPLKSPLQRATQVANTVFAGPASGADAVPTFRALTTADGASIMVLLCAVKSAAVSASVSFTSADFSWTAYNAYLIRLRNVLPASNGFQLAVTVSEDAGATYLAGTNYNYQGNFLHADATARPVSAQNDSSWLITDAALGISNSATNGGFSGDILIVKPNQANRHHLILQSCSWFPGATSNNGGGSGSCLVIGTPAALTGIKFAMTSGNITSGDFVAYGLKTA